MSVLWIDPPDDGDTRWTVAGDLREIVDLDAASTRYVRSTNYAVQELLVAEGWPAAELDPEYSCFFAYVADEARAIKLAADALRLAEGLK